MVDFADDFHFDPRISKRSPEFVAARDWDWLRTLRAAAADKDLDLDAGKNLSKHMVASGFVDVQTIELKCPYWRGATETQPESRLIIDLHVDDPYAVYWLLIQRLLEGTNYSQEQIQQFQADAQRDCCEGIGKYQVIYMTIGRKPEF